MDPTDRIERVDLTLARDYRFIATYPDQPACAPLVLDEPAPLGGGEGPYPAALLTTAVANCLASSLLFCARKARVPIDGMGVHAEAHIGRGPSGRRRVHHIDVTLAPALSSADTGRLERCKALFEDFCIVTAAVRDGIAVDVNVAPHTDAESLEKVS